MNKHTHLQNRFLLITGATVAIFSLILGLLVTFVVPSGCSVVIALVLGALFFLFIAGGTIFLIGQILSRWRHRLKRV